ncbi:hypothetical protein GCM10029976_057540 [Kribbella albertanoniae]
MSIAAVRPHVLSFSAWVNWRMVVLPEPAGPERKTVLGRRAGTESLMPGRIVRAAAAHSRRT